MDCFGEVSVEVPRLRRQSLQILYLSSMAEGPHYFAWRPDLRSCYRQLLGVLAGVPDT